MAEVAKMPKRLLKAITIPWEPPKHECLHKWRKRIADAKERGKFTKKDIKDALNWNACACGEAYARFDGLVAPDKGYCPRDTELDNLGCDFGTVVAGEEEYDEERREYFKVGGRPKDALPVLKRIERRLQQLDREFRAAHKVALRKYEKNGDLKPLIDLFAGIDKELPVPDSYDSRY